MQQARVALPRFDGCVMGNCVENVSDYISKDQRYRGMAHVTENNTVLNLHRVRAALDAITLDGVESVDVPCRHIRRRLWLTTYRNGREFSYGLNAYYTFRPAPDRAGRSPRIAITAPCGETKIYSLRLLDKMLSEFGV